MMREDGRMERPILLNSEMVRAVLDGRKTQTRRPLKPMPPRVEDVRESAGIDYGLFTDDRIPGVWRVSGPVWAVRDKMENQPDYPQWSCPYGNPGDLLWVRETWRETGSSQQADGKIPKYPTDNGTIIYAADHPEDGPFRPSIHMPRWASRILLEVVSVRVERVQDISPQDCEAEGIAGKSLPSPVRGQPYDEYTNGDGLVYTEPIHAFEALWDSIYADQPGRSWADNPWVWVVEFKRVKLDQVSGCSDGES
jgi:hypothetical protein